MSEHNLAHEQIKDLFSKFHASSEKFDYFMCSIAGGLFAYIGQTFTPEKFSFKCSVFTFAALIFLALSFFCGCRRILRQNVVTKTNHYIIAGEDLLAKMVRALKQSESFAQSPLKYELTNDLGEPYTVERLKNEKETKEMELNYLRAEFETHLKYTRYYGIERDSLLLVGFILILIAKIYQWSF